MYLAPSEYEFTIRQDVLAAINDGSDTRLEKAEIAAAKFMMSHLAKRYEITKIFYIVKEYDAAKAYATGQMVYWDDDATLQEFKVYEATEAIPIGVTPDDPRWELTEKRDELVMMYLADIAIYHFYAADGPVMNETVLTRYREAKEWVIGVGKGDMVADLPPNEAEEGDEDYNPDFRSGSREYEDPYW